MIKSTELCSYCNEEFDYEANDKEALITCPHCGKTTTQCNMCDRYKCEDCTLSKSTDAINDNMESLRKDLLKYLEDKGYWPGRIYLTEHSVRMVQEAIAMFLSTRATDFTWQVKADYTPAGDLSVFITNNIEKKEDKVAQEYFRGLLVPTEPKRDWTWMKYNKKYCSERGLDCKGIHCEHCIYSQWNCKARADFYNLTFGKTNQEQDFEVGDIVEYTAEHKTSLYTKEELTVTTPILAVRLEKETDSKLYLVYWHISKEPRYLDLSQYKVKLIKKAK